MKFRAIDFVVVFVADMDRAITFYRDTLGIAIIGIAVDDVQAAVDELRASGHAVAMDTIETPVCFMATMHDPDGNTLILHQRKDGTAG
ncbi:MAG: VOC family protein [Chloroflexi bacterium]|nr:VOC family protein [Chloroflexota bacterium]